MCYPSLMSESIKKIWREKKSGQQQQNKVEFY